MKLYRIIFACLIIAAAFHYGLAQEKPTAVLIDEFGAEPYEQLRGRADNLLREILKNPNSKGGIVIYGDEKFPFVKYSHEIEIKKHLELRQFDMSRIVFLHGKDEETIRTQLWLIPNGAGLPSFSEGDWSYKLPETIKPFIFHRNSFIVEDGFETFSLEFYSKLLKANPNLNGNLVIYEKSSGNYYLIADKLRKELVNKHGVQRNQLKFFFVKSNKSDVEFWFVPRN